MAVALLDASIRLCALARSKNCGARRVTAACALAATAEGLGAPHIASSVALAVASAHTRSAFRTWRSSRQLARDASVDPGVADADLPRVLRGLAGVRPTPFSARSRCAAREPVTVRRFCGGRRAPGSRSYRHGEEAAHCASSSMICAVQAAASAYRCSLGPGRVPSASSPATEARAGRRSRPAPARRGMKMVLEGCCPV